MQRRLWNLDTSSSRSAVFQDLKETELTGVADSLHSIAMIEPERKDTERSKEPEPTWEKGAAEYRDQVRPTRQVTVRPPEKLR